MKRRNVSRINRAPGMLALDLMVQEHGAGPWRGPPFLPRADRDNYSMWNRTGVLVAPARRCLAWRGRFAWAGCATGDWCGGLALPAGHVGCARRGTGNHATFWVMDSAVEGDNAHAGFVLQEAAAAAEHYRAEGKTVLLRCVRAESRTPTAAALYGASVAGVSPLEALADLQGVLPGAQPNAQFMHVLADAGTATDPVAGEATPAATN
jgi:ADP-ribosyl-[dinitrogen reductase] hydrolase